MSRKNKPAAAVTPATSSPAAPPAEKTHQVDVESSRCRKCGSTERTAYNRAMVQEFAGVDAEGKPYTHIVRRRTSCTDCGQARIDRTYENRVGSQK